MIWALKGGRLKNVGLVIRITCGAISHVRARSSKVRTINNWLSRLACAT